MQIHRFAMKIVGYGKHFTASSYDKLVTLTSDLSSCGGLMIYL